MRTRAVITDPPDPTVKDPRVKVTVEGPDCLLVAYLTPEGLGALLRACAAYRASIAATGGKGPAYGEAIV